MSTPVRIDPGISLADLPVSGEDCRWGHGYSTITPGRLPPRACWGNKWGNKPHRLQPIPADLDLAKTA
jgi:hypothetical protein